MNLKRNKTPRTTTHKAGDKYTKLLKLVLQPAAVIVAPIVTELVRYWLRS